MEDTDSRYKCVLQSFVINPGYRCIKSYKLLSFQRSTQFELAGPQAAQDVPPGGERAQLLPTPPSHAARIYS